MTRHIISPEIEEELRSTLFAGLGNTRQSKAADRNLEQIQKEREREKEHQQRLENKLKKKEQLKQKYKHTHSDLAPPTQLKVPEQSHPMLSRFVGNSLHPPKARANWLISPPPSPPENWEPILEGGPNKIPFIDLTPDTRDGVTVLLDQTETTPQIQILLT